MYHSFTPPQTVNAVNISLEQIEAATKCHLEFTDQKNGEKGEAVTHGDNTELLLSPLKAVRRRIEHLRQHHAPANTPLFTVYTPEGVQTVTSRHITAALRQSCKIIGPDLGISPKDISARALRAGGAMALLRSGIDDTLIRLQGRWKSWAMLEYLHRSATDTSEYAQLMVQGGTYVISRHETIPSDVAAILSSPVA